MSAGMFDQLISTRHVRSCTFQSILLATSRFLHGYSNSSLPYISAGGGLWIHGNRHEFISNMNSHRVRISSLRNHMFDFHEFVHWKSGTGNHTCEIYAFTCSRMWYHALRFPVYEFILDAYEIMHKKSLLWFHPEWNIRIHGSPTRLVLEG